MICTCLLRCVLTCRELHPAADLEDGGGAAEEEEREAADAGEHQHHGGAHEERRGLEGSWRDGAEVGEGAVAGQLARHAVTDAVVEEAEVADLRGLRAVADPVGLDEAHHVDDGEQHGEDGPQHADGARVPHVVRLVDLGGFWCGEHLCRLSAQISLLTRKK